MGGKNVTLDWDKFSLASDADPSVNIYRNETPLPRAFMVHRTISATDHDDAWLSIQDPGFDPATTVVLEGGQSMDIQPERQASVGVARYDSNALEIVVDTPAEGYLFLSDPYYPGWRAKVDGEPAPILRANYAFRAVAVPAGSHQVTMAFQPTSWFAGLGITALTLLGLVVLLVVLLFRRRQADR